MNNVGRVKDICVVIYALSIVFALKVHICNVKDSSISLFPKLFIVI